MSDLNSVGEALRSMREEKNITLERANQATKIAVNVLKALEQDDFESFESDIYLKGFLRTYARYLGLDVHEILLALERSRGGTPTTRGTIWDIEESVKEEKLRSPQIFRRFVVPLLIILIIVLTFLFMRERRRANTLTEPGAQGYLQVESTSLT